MYVLYPDEEGQVFPEGIVGYDLHPSGPSLSVHEDTSHYKVGYDGSKSSVYGGRERERERGGGRERESER